MTASNQIIESITREAESLLPYMTDIRRALHEYPEVGLMLPKTQRKISQELESIGLSPLYATTSSSIAAVIEARPPSRIAQQTPLVLLRSDMDALPIIEQSGESFSSQNSAMHACGHDFHMAILLGAAKIIHSHRDQLTSDVAFGFQAGEEGHGGAELFLKDPAFLGFMGRATSTFALHVQAQVPSSGMVATRGGAIMSASSDLRITVKGQGGHGSTPHESIDPITAASEMIIALQTMVTRKINTFDPVVISVGSIHAGEVPNAIPDIVEIQATVRYFSEDTRQLLETGLERVCKSIAAAHGLEVSIDLQEISEATINDHHAASKVHELAEVMFGAARVMELPHPVMQSEDYSCFLKRIPGAMCFIGASVPGEKSSLNHSPKVRFDESALVTGAALMAALAICAE